MRHSRAPNGVSDCILAQDYQAQLDAEEKAEQLSADDRDGAPKGFRWADPTQTAVQCRQCHAVLKAAGFAARHPTTIACLTGSRAKRKRIENGKAQVRAPAGAWPRLLTRAAR